MQKCSITQQSFQMIEHQSRRQEMEIYQRGYRAEEPYRAGTHLYLAGELQSPFEEMELPYPEMPPMEQPEEN